MTERSMKQLLSAAGFRIRMLRGIIRTIHKKKYGHNNSREEMIVYAKLHDIHTYLRTLQVGEKDD